MAFFGDDFLEAALGRISEALQLTETQYAAAERAYQAVGEWLGESGPVASLNPRIFPQGSMALGTTVKPQGRVEYDLDMVLEINAVDCSPKWLYESVRDRLAQNNRYKSMLTEMRRCLRLEYAGQFHLDIVPARTHRRLGPPFIEIPQAPERDRELHRWAISNPSGYIDWFQNQCAKATGFLRALQKATIEALPRPILAREKPVLACSVQLMKRRRDLVFQNSPDAPSSIVLTTLAGNFYSGEEKIEGALPAILDKVVSFLREDPTLGSLQNPSTGEYLCANWTEYQTKNFSSFVARFRDSMNFLTETHGIPKIGDALKQLFGEETVTGPDVISKAINEYAQDFAKSRESGELRFSRSGLTTVGGMAIKHNTYYGGEND